MTDSYFLRATLATEQPWAVTPEQVREVVARLVAAASPLRLIAQRCAQACGYGSAARGDLAPLTTWTCCQGTQGPNP